MKVLVQGQDPKEHKHEVQCKNCFSTIQFTEGEATRQSSYQGAYLRLYCPVCNAVITKQVSKF